MKLIRRKFLQLAAGAVALPAVSRIAFAQAYPSQPVRIIVGFAAGSGTDIFARLMAQWLSERIGQTVLIENRPGGGGNIGTEAVVKAPPDGYTLLQVGAGQRGQQHALREAQLQFHPRHRAGRRHLARTPYVLVVNHVLPVRTVPEFIAHAKANPGKLNFASAGVGTGIHMAGELFKLMAGVDMVHVPYRGAGRRDDRPDRRPGAAHVRHHAGLDRAHQSRQDPRAGGTHGGALAAPAGRCRPWASSCRATRRAARSGSARRRTRLPTIVDKLNREINAVLADPKVKARLADLGSEPLAGSPAEFGKLMAEETEKWGKVVRAANIKVE